MVGTRHILGLAVDDCGVVATELSIRSGNVEMRGIGEFPWEKELTADNAKELGQQLRRFLRDQGFTARRAVIGLAAKWILAKEIEAPPAGPDALAGILSIQAERLFSLNAGELVFDYCGKTSTSEKRQVLLLAARRQVVDRIRDLASAAGLHVQSITVSAFACGSTPSVNGSATHYGLYTRPTYCEFWGQVEGSPRFIKHIPVGENGNPSGYADLLTTTIQRQVLLSARQDQSPPHHVTAYDACGFEQEVFDRLNERLGPQITVCDGRAGLLSDTFGASDHSQDPRAIAATALALTAVGTEGPVVDFLNPRIGEKKAVSRKRAIVWAAVAAASVLIVLVVMLAGWQSDRRAVAAYTGQLEEMSTDLAAAQEVVERLTYAAAWGSTGPRFLNCLRALTLAFPDEGTIWVTSLALNENNAGSVVGRATSQESFYAILDRMRENEAFSNVQMRHLRDSGQNSREQEFAISFTFRGAR